MPVNIHYKYKRDPNPEVKDEKLAPQARWIFDHIKKAGDKGINKTDLAQLMQKDIDAGKYETVQRPESLINYYDKLMCQKELGLIEKISEKTEKPKAAKKDKAPKKETVAEAQEKAKTAEKQEPVAAGK